MRPDKRRRLLDLMRPDVTDLAPAELGELMRLLAERDADNQRVLDLALLEHAQGATLGQTARP